MPVELPPQTILKIAAVSLAVAMVFGFLISMTSPGSVPPFGWAWLTGIFTGVVAYVLGANDAGRSQRA